MKAFLFFSAISLVLLSGLFFLQTTNRDDGKLHIVFCDVGQGDAILIRTPAGTDILFDGGPNKKVLSCLSEHLPFWDRDIELMFLSHPHADHLIGLLDVIDRYSLRYFVTEDLANNTAEFRALLANVEKAGIKQKKVYANDRFRAPEGVTITVLGPTKEYLERTRGNGVINSSEFASLILHVQYKKFDVLLTGDSQSIEMADATADLKKIDILHVPHHGSRTGLTSEILTRLKPKVSVISVGKNNYGHPSKLTLEELTKVETKVLRTDREGDIEIVTDGEQWSVR
jgi:competence protein ComEC